MLRSRSSLRTMMSEAARPAAARARRCADDVSDEGATPTASTPAASVVLALALGAALGTTARCDCDGIEDAGSAELVPRLEARMRIVARG